MTYVLWYFIGASVIEVGWMIRQIGKHRPPVTGADAIGTLVIAAAHVAAFVWILGGLK